jgi:DNA modification methylase
MGSHAKERFIDSWEAIFHCGNKDLNWPEVWDESRFDVQIFAAPQSNYADQKLHPTQKPLALIQWLVNYGSCPGDRVLDPFAGSGTTGEACLGTRECVLIERDPGYAKVIRSRLQL